VGPVYAMKAQTVGCIGPRILNRGTRRTRMINFTTTTLPPLRPIYPRRETRYPLNRKLCRPQSRSGTNMCL